MAKIMLVEDDNNLREIYEARLLAEGHEIVSAKDGEEALALAVKERPDLIISDIMMPNISGFDMLDILRSTPETKNTKVIMMTALSQAEDKARASKLGADRYLVKSQVTLEDVVKAAKEVLEGATDPPLNMDKPASTPNPSDTEKSTEKSDKAVSPAKDTKSIEPLTASIPVVSSSPASATTQGEKPVAPEPKPTDTTEEKAPENTAPIKPAETEKKPEPTVSIPEPTKIPDAETKEANKEDDSSATKSTPHAPGDSTNLQDDDNSTGSDTIQTLPVVEINDSPATEGETSEPADQKPDQDSHEDKQDDTDSGITATTTPPPLPEPEVVKPNASIAPISTASDTSLDDDDKPATVLHTKVIKPISDFKKQKTDFETLVAKEEAKESDVVAAQPVVQDIEEVKEGGEAPSPQTITPGGGSEKVDPNSVAL